MQVRGFYTVEQAADTLDLTPGRIRQVLRGGDLECSKEPGDRGWRITRESVEEVRRRRPPPRERGGATEDRGELVEALRREDEYLRRQLDQATERDRRTGAYSPQLSNAYRRISKHRQWSENPISAKPLPHTTPTEAAAGPQTKTSHPQRSIWRHLFGR